MSELDNFATVEAYKNPESKIEAYMYFYKYCFNDASNILGSEIIEVDYRTEYFLKQYLTTHPIETNSIFFRRSKAVSSVTKYVDKKTGLTIIEYITIVETLQIKFSFIKRSDWIKLHRKMIDIRKSYRKKPYLNDSIKEKINNFIKSVRRTKRKVYGLKINRGLLLSGDPGNGKSFISRYVFQKNKTITLHYNESELISAIQRGKILYNCILDDISSDIFSRSHPVSTSLLSLLDNSGGSEPSLRIFTTNEDISNIDKAFLRPGRIDEVIAVENPNEKTIREIFDDWIVDFKYDKEVLVKEALGSTYAELNYIKMLLVDNHFNGTNFSTKNIIENAKNHISLERDRQMGFRS